VPPTIALSFSHFDAAAVNPSPNLRYKLYENPRMRLFRRPDARTPAHTAEDETRLLERFRSGDRAAFDTLYARYAGPVLTFALHLTGCRADAEDLLQETFLAAYRGAAGYRGDSRLHTWLIAIALRRFRDGSRRPRPPLLPLFEETDTPDGASPVERTAVTAVLFRQSVDALDTNLREAFLLVVVEGLTHGEAADVLGAPVGTVKWRVAEANRRLRAALEATEERQHETQALPEVQT
jgi:RNA polymerase sigma factor (sigma-70 family)